MGKAGKVAVIAAALGACAAAALSAHAAATDLPFGTPDPSAIALHAADFRSGATDASHSTIPGTFPLVAGYENVVRFTPPYGVSKYVRVDSTALVETDTVNAVYEYAQLVHKYTSAAFRKQVARIAGVPKGVTTIAFKPRSLGYLDSTLEIGFVVSVPRKAPVHVSVELLRMYRVVVSNIAIGSGKVMTVHDAKVFVGWEGIDIAPRIAPALAIEPTVSGTAQVGQTLTATQGTWIQIGPPATYSYQWEHYDAASTLYTPIPGATGVSYVLQSTDVDQNVCVAVIATTRYGNTYAYSATTPPVSP